MLPEDSRICNMQHSFPIVTMPQPQPLDWSPHISTTSQSNHSGLSLMKHLLCLNSMIQINLAYKPKAQHSTLNYFIVRALCYPHMKFAAQSIRQNLFG